ncbi:hypothetical protein A3A50_03800 [Candidatus Woesebacteria bacterium RIFCSPLOWO2_01_FULL_38_20]|nr:MAG: hypothetical protein A3A50_03800 [Candidatus Woesebacteria bacterium RIFCSPLOWO2_01_FULL_38_20]
MIKKEYSRILRYQQEDGWCGPAVVQMALAVGRIRKTQKAVAKDIYQPWWGTTQQAIHAYLSKYFSRLNSKNNSKISDILYHLNKDHAIIVNWWDDINTDPDDADGHYCLILDYDQKNRKLVLADPSERRGIWKMGRKDFNDRWYDAIDLAGKKWIDGWMLWIDPTSRI